MAVVASANCQKPFSAVPLSVNLNCRSVKAPAWFFNPPRKSVRHRGLAVNGLATGSDQNSPQDDEVDSIGVKAALSMLRFYKGEISPLLPNSCRYVPTCSEYSMEAYKKYGVVKGTVLTAWRLCRCNPLGGSGFDPPRWFDEVSPPEE